MLVSYENYSYRANFFLILNIAEGECVFEIEVVYEQRYVPTACDFPLLAGY